MKKIAILLVFITSITIMACNKESSSNIISENVNSDSKSLPQKTFCDVQNNILFIGQTNYTVLGDSADVECLFYDLRSNPLAPAQAGVLDKNTQQLSILANNISLSSTTTYSINTLGSLFGTNVSYTIGSINPTSYDMYIPSRINFISPPIIHYEDLFPLCYYDKLEIKWNADIRNKNGIVVIVEWTGSMYAADDVQGIHIRNIDVLPEDDGIEVLNNQLFDEIPEDAIATMTIIRGNSKIIGYNNQLVKLSGETAMSLPFILVRDMSHYN